MPKEIKTSLCLIVKPSKSEARLLDRALGYVAKYVDEICVTQAGTEPSKVVSKIIKKYKGKESFFKWVNDFAAARNYNFSQAKGKYIFWIDSDDVVRGAEKIPVLIQRMEEEKIDAVVMNYLYDFDAYGQCITKHLKTRIVRQDAVRWVGEIHEDFEEVRQINAVLTEDVEILHQTDKKRIEQSAERNLLIAKEFLVKKPDDPRSYWLMANTLRQTRSSEAEQYFKEFITRSYSEEEKYLAYLNLGDITSERKYYFEAINLRPKYPNAYFNLGYLNAKDKLYQSAIDYILLGLTLPIPDKSMIVWNPREYDFIPLMTLVNIYFDTGKIQEAIKTIKICQKIYPHDKNIQEKYGILLQEAKDLTEIDTYLEEAKKLEGEALRTYLDNLPEKLKQHPKVCYLRNSKFWKKTSSGKDLVYYCSWTDKDWNPFIAETKGIGGSEEAVIQLTKRWAEAGWNVTVYNNCGKPWVYQGVNYRPFWEFNVRDKQDVVVVWRHPMPVDYDINAKTILIDMHDVLGEAEFTQDRLKKITKIMVKSKAHRDLFPNIPDEKFAIVPNGIDPEQFNCEVKKDPYRILNTSSPERSLEAVLNIFEEMIKREPDKPWKLVWYYGWGIFDKVHEENDQMKQWKKGIEARFNALVARGYAEGGTMISHNQIAEEYLKAGVFLYPTQFYEISCISAMKAQLVGCKMVTSDFAALKETVKGPTIHTEGEKWGSESTFGDTETDKYVDAILHWEKKNCREQIIQEYHWNLISELWLKNFS